jgi:hypothetical protein
MYGLTMEQAAALRQQTGAAASSSSSSKEDLWLSGLDSQASSNEEPFGLLSHKPLEHWVAGGFIRLGHCDSCCITTYLNCCCLQS